MIKTYVWYPYNSANAPSTVDGADQTGQSIDITATNGTLLLVILLRLKVSMKLTA